MFRLNSDIIARDRQEALYGFLAGRRPDEWIPLRDIPKALPLYPDSYAGNFHNSTARRWITSDIEAINDDPQFQKIIISSTRGVKIADRDEFEYWVRAEYAEIFSKLGRVRYLVKKAGLDGQYDLFEEEIYAAFAEV